MAQSHGLDQRIGSIDRGRKSMHGSDPWIRFMYRTHRSASGKSRPQGRTRSHKVSQGLDHGHGLCHGPQPTAWPRPRPRHGHGHGSATAACMYIYIYIYICRHLGSRYIASLWAKCLGDTVDRWNGGFLPTDQSIDRSTDTLCLLYTSDAADEEG